MWQAEGIEANVHNAVRVITRNPQRCLVACIVRCVSCWHVLASARQILHSTKCHPSELCQMQEPSYGDKFFCFLDFINCHSSVHGYRIAFSCFKVCQQPVGHGIMMHKAFTNCLCIWLMLLSGLLYLPEGLLDHGSSIMS
jgi:hypothetical protein